MSAAEYEQVAALAKSLSRLEKIQLIEEVMATLKQELTGTDTDELSENPKPRRSAYGILADLGPAPSAEDIDEVRKEVWKNFPREDI